LIKYEPTTAVDFDDVIEFPTKQEDF